MFRFTYSSKAALRVLHKDVSISFETQMVCAQTQQGNNSNPASSYGDTNKRLLVQVKLSAFAHNVVSSNPRTASELLLDPAAGYCIVQ